MHSIAPKTMKLRNAFTLVELLVAIAIIGILMGIAIPATMSAVRRARVTAIRLEISALEKAIEQYEQKYGDYPPDFSSWPVVQRHYRKLFPRMSTDDATLLFNLLHNTASPPVFQADVLDRGEALVWTLGGYSNDVQRPFTGPGGPLAWVGSGTYAAASATAKQTATNYQINSDRVNSLFDFDSSRLDYGTINASAAVSPTNRYLSSDSDLFLSYVSRDDGPPIIYFDSRTYDVFDAGLSDFNGYDNTTFGIIRPYYSDKSVANTTGANYTSNDAALQAWQFVNPNTFQIISGGLDNLLGPTSAAGYNVDGDAALEPVYFQYPTGQAIAPRTDVDTPGELLISGVSKYDHNTIFSDAERAHNDNITNFSNAELVDDVP